MHILLVADGRSPITRRWIQGMLATGQRVTLVSTFPCPPAPGVEEQFVLPVAFGQFSSGYSTVNPDRPTARVGLRQAVGRFRLLFLSGRYLLGPVTLWYYGPRFRRLVQQIQPDVVHALRIPFEGMLAAYTPPQVPFVVSIWGNDLTLHAAGSTAMRGLTRRVLRRADGLMADAGRDVRLARSWGFGSEKPALVVPGAGGVDFAEIERIREHSFDPLSDLLPAGVPLVVNPRGIRPAYVRNDVFFQAIPLVLERYPRVAFVCPAMAGQEDALRWMRRLNLDGKVFLLPHLPQAHLWDLFLRAEITVSISEHDGTPNTLLEAMACGCFPIVGDIESLREWITPGVNGLLVEPGKAQALAEAILVALDHSELRRSAATINAERVKEKADTQRVCQKVAEFYRFFTPVES